MTWSKKGLLAKTGPLYSSLNRGSLHFRFQKDLFIYYSCHTDKAFLNLDFPRNFLYTFCMDTFRYYFQIFCTDPDLSKSKVVHISSNQSCPYGMLTYSTCSYMMCGSPVLVLQQFSFNKFQIQNAPHLQLHLQDYVLYSCVAYTKPPSINLHCYTLPLSGQKDCCIYVLFLCHTDKAFLNLDLPRIFLHFCYISVTTPVHTVCISSRLSQNLNFFQMFGQYV